MIRGRAHRLLLTGASGFIGRQVAASLSQGIELHCVSRSHPRRGMQGVWHEVDLRDRHGCVRLIEDIRPTHLVHLAWNTEHGRFWDAPDNADWRDAGISLVEAFARTGGQRLVISGTCAEYSVTAPSPLHETEALVDPATPYGQAKRALHLEASRIADAYGVAFAWARLFYVYGIGEKPGRLVPSIIEAISRGLPARCSSGCQFRDFIDVRDLGEALARLTMSTIEGPINLGSGASATIAEIAQTIGALMGRPDLVALGALPDRAGEPLVQVPSVDRMKTELGFVPRIPLADGLRGAIRWWDRVERAGYQRISNEGSLHSQAGDREQAGSQ